VLFDKSKATLICCPDGKAGLYIIPNTVTSIASSAFNHCSNLISIIIPGSVTRIESSAFVECSGLVSITIPEGVTQIGERAFSDCSNLTLITNLNPLPVVLPPFVFENVPQSKCTLNVPLKSVSNYKNADGWKEFNIVGIEKN
jgi:hypothetical protein